MVLSGKWRGGGGAILARWTTDWDCGYETNWWYIIKDTPFDISALKSKRRYEIIRGNKNFEIKPIKPFEFAEEIYKIFTEAYTMYPIFYRPQHSHDRFIKDLRNWNDYRNYGAFLKDNGSLCGIARLRRKGNYIDFTGLKVNPNQEKLAINAAIINKILIDHEKFLKEGGYICDGSRNIQHRTYFQDYLEKYFQFRKAYCKLHIKYNQLLKIGITLTYPFRGLFEKIDIPLMQKLNSLLKMEEIRRTFI